jgi:hypothetical protein
VLFRSIANMLKTKYLGTKLIYSQLQGLQVRITLRNGYLTDESVECCQVRQRDRPISLKVESLCACDIECVRLIERDQMKE